MLLGLSNTLLPNAQKLISYSFLYFLFLVARAGGRKLESSYIEEMYLNRAVFSIFSCKLRPKKYLPFKITVIVLTVTLLHQHYLHIDLFSPLFLSFCHIIGSLKLKVYIPSQKLHANIL